jgi:8-oxo-dGTP diphosphatase
MILASLCYIRHAGQTLMIHRVKRADDIHLGKWNGLGGKFEPGESPEECVTREVREESGLELRQPRLCGLLFFPGFSGELKENEEGYLEWIPDDKLESLPLWPSDHIFLPWIRAGKFFSAKFVYNGDEMIDHSVTFYNHPDLLK